MGTRKGEWNTEPYLTLLLTEYIGLLSKTSLKRPGHGEVRGWQEEAAVYWIHTSVVQLFSLTLSQSDFLWPMDCSTSGFPVPELAQTHVHWVSDAFQSSHPLSRPSSPALNLSQHQGLFQWVGSSHQVAKSIKTSASASVLPVNIQGWFPLGLTGCISLQSKGHSGVFSSTTIRKHPFFSTQPSSWSTSHIRIQLLEKP